MNINHELLAKFCADSDDPRDYLRAPMNGENYTYATNGHIGLRVQKFEDYPPSRVTASLDRLIDGAEKDRFTRLDNLPEPIFVPCEMCAQIGVVHLCATCEGSSPMICSMGHYHDCEDCDGEGIAPGSGENERECPDCRGEGRRMARYVRVEVGSASIDLIYALMIRGLDAEISPPSLSSEKAIYFRFPGGEGVVTPIKY